MWEEEIEYGDNDDFMSSLDDEKKRSKEYINDLKEALDDIWSWEFSFNLFNIIVSDINETIDQMDDEVVNKYLDKDAFKMFSDKINNYLNSKTIINE